MRRFLLLFLFSTFITALPAQIKKGEEYSAIHSGFAIGNNIQNLSFSFTRNLKIGKRKNFECYSGIGFDNTLSAAPLSFQLPDSYIYSVDPPIYFYRFTARVLIGFNLSITKKIKIGASMDVLDYSLLNKISKNIFVNYHYVSYDTVSQSFSIHHFYQTNAALTSNSWMAGLPFIGGYRYDFYFQYLVNENWLVKFNVNTIGTRIELTSYDPVMLKEMTFLGQNISFLYGLGVSYRINPKKISH
ncbi:MAG: hypothetical protein ACHQK8_01680 [Bacteroidia bacterium]